MVKGVMHSSDFTARDLLNIYHQGCFPMAESGDDPYFSIMEPYTRALLPIHDLHVPKSLKKCVLKEKFDIRINTAFSDVIEACSEPRLYADNTWINASIKRLFNELHDQGLAHSVEAWQDGQLVGGLYGLQLGAAFCGESMFSHATDSSKVALVHLCARLAHTGFTLLDSQLHNPHLEQFGLQLVPQEHYLSLLEDAQSSKPVFDTPMSQMDIVRQYLRATP